MTYGTNPIFIAFLQASPILLLKLLIWIDGHYLRWILFGVYLVGLFDGIGGILINLSCIFSFS